MSIHVNDRDPPPRQPSTHSPSVREAQGGYRGGEGGSHGMLHHSLRDFNQ
jgi:hypothetical protein